MTYGLERTVAVNQPDEPCQQNRSRSGSPPFGVSHPREGQDPRASPQQRPGLGADSDGQDSRFLKFGRPRSCSTERALRARREPSRRTSARSPAEATGGSAGVMQGCRRRQDGRRGSCVGGHSGFGRPGGQGVQAADPLPPDEVFDSGHHPLHSERGQGSRARPGPPDPRPRRSSQGSPRRRRRDGARLREADRHLAPPNGCNAITRDSVHYRGKYGRAAGPRASRVWAGRHRRP